MEKQVVYVIYEERECRAGARCDGFSDRKLLAIYQTRELAQAYLQDYAGKHPGGYLEEDRYNLYYDDCAFCNSTADPCTEDVYLKNGDYYSVHSIQFEEMEVKTELGV